MVIIGGAEMADNKMYLRCIVCGKNFFLGKRLGGGYYIRNYEPDRGTFEKRLNDFYSEHEHYKCGLDCFKILYEDGDEYFPGSDDSNV